MIAYQAARKWLLAGAVAWPAVADAQINTPQTRQGAPSSLPAVQVPDRVAPEASAPIVPDSEFEQAVPPIDNDINAPLTPLPPTAPPGTPAAGAPSVAVPEDPAAPIAPVPVPQAAELAQPLPPIAGFDATPVVIADVDDAKPVEIRYETRVDGLEAIGLSARFDALSALREDRDAPNTAVVAARAREDEALAVRLMHALGYYDATAASTIEQTPGTPGRLRATITASPGKLYTLASITVKAAPTVPPDLIASALPLKVGDAIDAERIQGGEANVSLTLPQRGYAFATVGQRDILLDEATAKGDYTLPVETGPRATFGGIVSKGDAVFDTDHIAILQRYATGDLYDSRKVDDLRQALVATNLFSSIAVEPQRTGRTGPDGTEQVNLLVTQNKGPARSLAATAGYNTGQGFRAEGSWTHRNLFPYEGALIGAAVLGTQEQALSGTFRRSNAGQRDRTFTLLASLNHTNYDAFESFTGTLSARWLRDSTPIWQKRFTYAYGVELVGTNEDRFNFDLGRRDRGTYFIAALPLQGGWDTSDNLLNPTHGFRFKANVSPETSVRGAVRPYARILLEGTAYYPIGGSFVFAARLRAGSIPGIDRDDLAPSRRFYSGGGGSVRGFGYQELGPRTLEPRLDDDGAVEVDDDGNPIIERRPVGGRSVNEAAIELRYRFGDFGIVPFFDIGQVYDSVLPTASNLRYGAGIGGRFYTNFGPFRVDVATPINRQPGESKIALYLSIGQAF